ncbi:carboxymuconolactone decarboxylase family protein [Amycolatopsis sp. K13G38]|uniref:Carboxymuconolactone decarboxylase family protein n=1 Tax=Amycolatopsis acididurans TaxID=2724524 RepID=A0ABX1J5I5_9PSEU|nr:carboxymuconolactone decarboxylase family protein [Amycolatopsis acididurans]NKQ54874.1 carboxymuconolactone decarboxylase family protein [Amycolatopsis acididurans]
MARLDYVVEGGDVADRIRQRRGGRLTPLDGMLLHSPRFADGWNSLLGAIRGASTLPGDIRELAVLRVAELNGAAYEWAAHEPVAREAGMSGEQLAALRVGADTGALDDRQRATLAYTDAMTNDIAVEDELFRLLGKHFDDQQLVELTVTVAAYNMVSRFLVALEVGKE